MVKVATRSITTITKAEVVGAEVGKMDAEVAETGHGIVKITLIKIISDLSMHSHRHQTLGSRISPRNLKIACKVRTIGVILWILFLIRPVISAYEDLDFENWNDVEYKMLVDANNIDSTSYAGLHEHNQVINDINHD